jgi:acetylornithine deacetylase
MLDPAELLERLVAIPSVNPMGRTGIGSAAQPADILGEARLTAFLETTLQSLGLRTERQTVEPGRDNLLARLDGDPSPNQGCRVLLLDAHQDTVPVDGMVEPFAAVRRDGRLYGRGACDVKGPMAAMIALVARLRQRRPRPTIVLSFTINEEYGFSGVRTLVESWQNGRAPKILDGLTPHAAIVAEPTAFDVVVGHKGVVRWRCHARGRAAHSSRPELGENAIYRIARAVAAIEQYAATLGQQSPGETVSVGLIHGGVSANTVPDLATIEIDYRLPVGRTPEAARGRLIEHIDRATSVPLEHEPPSTSGLALGGPQNAELAARLAAIAHRVSGRGALLDVPYCTNAAYLAAAGLPTVVFGPGDIAQAHTADEWIALSQLPTAVDILEQFCTASTDIG